MLVALATAQGPSSEIIKSLVLLIIVVGVGVVVVTTIDMDIVLLVLKDIVCFIGLFLFLGVVAAATAVNPKSSIPLVVDCCCCWGKGRSHSLFELFHGSLHFQHG